MATSRTYEELVGLLRRSSLSKHEKVVLADIVESTQGTRWDDLKFPANATKEIVGKEPGIEAATGLLLFAASGTEAVSLLAQMPHAWKEGSVLHPHVHWMKTTSAAGDVMWELQYKIAPIGEIMDASWTTLTNSSPVGGTPDTDTADYHMITSFDPIDMTGHTLSTCIIFLLSRLGSDAADTYGADARLLEFDVHYELDSNGSREEFIK